jgi:hypothetical protein
VLGKKKMANMFPDIGKVTITAEGIVEIVMLDVSVIGLASKPNAKQVSNSGRKRKDNGELSSNKLKKVAHSATSFLQYYEA